MNVKQPHESIETLLKDAKRLADPAFEQQLEDKLLLLLEQGCADSETEHDNSKENIIMLGNGFAQNKHGLRYKLAVAVMTLFIVSVTVMTVPPLRALAQDIIDTVFVKTESDTRDTVKPNPYIIRSTSMTGAEDFAGFEIAAPVNSLDGFKFNQVVVTSFNDPVTEELQTVFAEMKYVDPDDYDKSSIFAAPTHEYVLSISQAQGYSESEWWNTYGGIPVGASAEIETITIAGVAAQYVRGGWDFDSASAVRTWDNEYPKHILTWQQNGFLLAVITSTDITERDEIIAIAEFLVPRYADVVSTQPPEPGSVDTIFVNLEMDAQELGDQFAVVPAYEYEQSQNRRIFETIAEAEDALGFDIIEPTYMTYGSTPMNIATRLPGYNSSIGAVTGDVGVSYLYRAPLYYLSVGQSLLDPDNSQYEYLFREIGASAEIETITIGDVEAQYVAGYWSGGYPEPETYEWINDDIVQRMAWWQDGFLFEIYASFGGISKEQFIAIAESMILGDDFSPPDWVNPPILVNVDGDTLSVIPVELHLGDNRYRTARYSNYHAYSRSASSIADFKLIGTDLWAYQLIEPVFIPDELNLYLVETLTQSSSVSRPFSLITEVGTVLTYRDTDDEHYLTIVQMVVDTENVEDWWQEHNGLPVGASAEIETIEIGDTTAYYVQGGWQRENDVGWHLPGEWDNDFPRHTLAWWQDGYLMSIVTRATDRISKDDLIAIAESMIESTQ
jgi:hypothetical protein